MYSCICGGGVERRAAKRQALTRSTVPAKSYSIFCYVRRARLIIQHSPSVSGLSKMLLL